MLIKRYLTLLLFFGCIQAFLNAYSQSPVGTGEVTIIKDSRINQLEEQYLKYAANQNRLDGFRVQIFFDSGNQSKRNASSTRERFLQRYPSTNAYIDFKEPFFRVRVGDFRTRLEAEGFKQIISGDYPNAFTVNDKINPPSIN